MNLGLQQTHQRHAVFQQFCLEDIIETCVYEQQFKQVVTDIYNHVDEPKQQNFVQFVLNTNTNMSKRFWDIIEDKEVYTRDLLLITNGILPDEIFPFTNQNNRRKLHANSVPNRDRQFKAFFQHCATNLLKCEYIDVHFSPKDDHTLKTTELIKRKGCNQAFLNFAEKAKNPTHDHH